MILFVIKHYQTIVVGVAVVKNAYTVAQCCRTAYATYTSAVQWYRGRQQQRLLPCDDIIIEAEADSEEEDIVALTYIA